ncbi:MAG: nuclear transport factor 2 family protein [Thermoguttaceae bacterium]|jgi:hypothetical protein
MRFALLVLSVAFLTSETFAQELSKEQSEPWSTLNRQVGLYFQRDWKEHDKYIHRKIVDWGDSMPSPIHSGDGEAKKYFEQVEDGADKVVAFHLVPVSVVVAGDVAIINAHLHVLTKPDGKSVEKIFRLHNTWKKEDGRWQLLATYNTSIASGDCDD